MEVDKENDEEKKFVWYDKEDHVFKLSPEIEDFDILKVSLRKTKGNLLAPGEYLPKVSIGKNALAYNIYIDLPGVETEKVEVKKTGRGRIQVKGQKIKELEGQSIEKDERTYGFFDLSFKIPKPFEPPPVKTWTANVLHLKFVKADENVVY